MRRQNSAGVSTSLETEGRDLVERLGGAWQRGGGMCRCPAHDDRTPSLSVRPGVRRLLFHCFAGCGTDRIIRALNALRLLGPHHHGIGGEGARVSVDSARRNRGAAARLWASARPIGGSPAEAYLLGRGLKPAAPDLRYHPRTPYGHGVDVVFRAALLAAVRAETGLVGVHRTFLEPGTAKLAELPIPKRALGRLGQGAVRLHAPRDGQLGWAEGIENALAATRLFEIACWATLGTERFARVALPAGVSRLILFLDNDHGGRRAEKLAREAHQGAHLEIDVRYPRPVGADWNDVLLERMRKS